MTTRPMVHERPHDVPARRILDVARWAPSVHNTQPWLWRIGEDRVDLYADRSRQLTVADKQGRNLTISCGAAVHHARVAAAALGWPASVTRMPDPTEPDLLATLDLEERHATPEALAELSALEQRCTDRRRFTSWPIPDERLLGLARSVDVPGIQVVPLTDVSDRFRVELLVNHAMSRQEADSRYSEEQREWIDHSRVDGLPSDVVSPAGGFPRAHLSRFADAATAVQRREPVESSDGLLAVCSDGDDPESWLRSGEALSELWLQATTEGLSVVPLSQVIEVEETRQELRHGVFGGLVHPQILVRIGWQEIGRSHQPRTPRRPLEDLLLH